MKKIFTLAFIAITTISLMAQSGVKSGDAMTAQKSDANFKAYLTVSSKGKALENAGLQKVNIEDKIKDAVSSEGIQIVPNEDIEKHGEHYLYIFVTLSDSLNIKTKSLSAAGGNSVITGLYPNKSYAYKGVSDITSSVKKYVRDYIKVKTSSVHK